MQVNKPFGLLVIKMIKTVVDNLKRRVQAAELNYSLDQLILLKAVQKEDEAVVQQDMAEKLRKDKSYILRLINAIEEDDLIKRVVNPEDRRKNILVITEKGLLLLDRFLTIENELLKDLQQGISQDEMDIFYKVIDQIQHNAEQA